MDMQQMKNKKYYLNGDSGSSTQTIQSLQICALLDPQFLSSVKSSKRCTTLSQEWKSHNDDHIDLDISSVNEDISFYDSEFKESRPELDKYSSSWPGHKKPLESSLQSLSQGSIMSKTLLYLKSDIKERENETKDKSNPEDEKTLSIVKADLDISSVNEDTSFYESEFKESGPELDKYSSSLPGHKKPLESSLKSLSQGSILSKILLSLKRDTKERESETKEKSNPEDLDISSVNEDVSFYDSEFKESGPELDKYSSSWPGHKKPLESSLKSLSEGSIMSKTLLSLESDIKERKNETKEKSNPEDEKTISVVKADLDISSVNEDISFYDSEFKESGPELDKYSSSWPGHKKPLESSLKSLSQGSILSKILLSSKRDIKERENETKGKSNPEDEKTISVVKADLKMIDAYEELRLQDDENSVPEVEYSSSWPKLNKTVQFTFKNLSQPEMPSRKNMIEKSRVFPINVESIVRMHPNPSQNDDVDIFSTSEDTCSEDDYNNDADDYDSELGLSLYEPASWPGFGNNSEDKKMCFRSSSQPVILTNRSNSTNDNLPIKLNKNYGSVDKKDNANMLHQSSEITDIPREDPDIYHDKVAEKRTVTCEEEGECHFKQLDIRNISIVSSGLYTAGQEILPTNKETVSSHKKFINGCEFNSTSTDYLSNVDDIPVAEDVSTPPLKDTFFENPIDEIMDTDGDTDSQIVPCLSLELNNKLQNNNVTEMEELNVSCSNQRTDFAHNIDVMEVLHDLWASSNEKECAHLESLHPKFKMNDCSASKENKYTSEQDQGIDSSLNSSVEETVHKNQPNPLLDIIVSTPESYKEVCYKVIQNVSEDSSAADIDLIDPVCSLVDQEAPDTSLTDDCASHVNSTSSPPKSEYLEDILYTEIDKAFVKYEEKMANEPENYQELGRNSLMKDVGVQTEVTNANIFHQCKCTEYNVCNKKSKSIPVKHTKSISFNEIEAKIALKRSMQALCLEIPTLKRIRLQKEVNVNVQVGKEEELFQQEYEQRNVIQQRTPNIKYNCRFKNNTIGGNKEGEEGEKEEEEVCKLLSTTMSLNSFTNSQIKEKDQEVPRASGKYLQTNNYNCPAPEYFSLRSAFPWQNSLITNSAKIYTTEELIKEEEEHNQDSLSSHPAPRLRLGLSKRAKPRRLHISKN